VSSVGCGCGGTQPQSLTSAELEQIRQAQEERAKQEAAAQRDSLAAATVNSRG